MENVARIPVPNSRRSVLVKRNPAIRATADIIDPCRSCVQVGTVMKNSAGGYTALSTDHRSVVQAANLDGAVMGLVESME